jgi:hypothetical protein
MRTTTFLLATILISACDDHPHVAGPDGVAESSRDGINGSGNIVTESRSVGGFHGVSFGGIGRLVIDQTGTSSLTVTAEDNIQPVLVSEVVDGRLMLGVAGNTNLGRVQEIVFRLTVESLDELWATGAATVEATGIDTDRLEVHITGATTVTFAGRADYQTITLVGASTYDAAALTSREVVAEATGASRIVVRVSDRLRAYVRGASLITYIGNPVVTVDGHPGSVQPQ